ATERVGDSLLDFRAELTPREIEEFFAQPNGPMAARLLGAATSRTIYDPTRFARNPSARQPTWPASIARETHASDLQAGQSSRLRISFSFADGFGRSIQTKAKTEPGPIMDGGEPVAARWIGSGWTIYDNKGRPVRQYEPFFDDTHDFRFASMRGVSPILF